MPAFFGGEAHFWDLRLEMPQTVPSAGFSPTASSPPCDFSHFTADCFDLSLLPSPDGEVPYSPVSLQQVMSFYSDPTSSPPSMFPSAPSDVEGTKPPPQAVSGAAAGPGEGPASSLYAPVPAGVVKEEPAFTSFLPSPTPPSPASERGLDLQDILQESRFLQETVAKREQRRFSCAAERSKYPAAPPQSLPPAYTLPPPEEGPGGAGPAGAAASPDHRLLREVLRDTSFQRKYNLKPFDFAGLAPGYVSAPAPPPPAIASTAGHTQAPPSPPPPPPEVKLEEGEALQLSRERMEPVLSLAIEQLRKDVGDACSLLGIPPDPCRWTAGDVRAWLLWTLRQYALQMVPLEYFAMDGAALVQLSEHDFTQRAPQCGSTLYAQLEIWKAACQDLDIPWTNSSTSSSSPRGDPSEGEDDEEDEESRDMNSEAGSPAGAATGSGSGSGARGVTGARPGTAGGSGTGGGGGGGAHIHLWQFLKELLAAPQLHGSCIRWLDRPKGVFKIEDSVRVARLWGKRKNRPAMNYDKLSRSIRQYYKKGIMKKTERSQRLVYQFCHPYSL